MQILALSLMNVPRGMHGMMQLGNEMIRYICDRRYLLGGKVRFHHTLFYKTVRVDEAAGYLNQFTQFLLNQPENNK